MTADSRISVIQGDITRLQVDAIVNAANKTLLGGGGVDGAIHRAAGPELLVECKTLGGCSTGQAIITGGYQLPAFWVIHTVGPVWQGGNKQEPELLAGCYQNCFKISKDKKFRTMAFPGISTGVYGFPKDKAAEIALVQTQNSLAQNSKLERVVFVCFDSETRRVYEEKIYDIVTGVRPT